jgi:hypothetical protein
VRAIFGLLTTPRSVTLEAARGQKRRTYRPWSPDRTTKWWLSFWVSIIVIMLLATFLGRGCAYLELSRRDTETRNAQKKFVREAIKDPGQNKLITFSAVVGECSSSSHHETMRDGS